MCQLSKSRMAASIASNEWITYVGMELELIGQLEMAMCFVHFVNISYVHIYMTWYDILLISLKGVLCPGV